MKKLKLLLYRTRRLRRLILFIILIVLFCMFISSRPHSYEYTYNLNNIEIIEKYNKDESVYYFTFAKGKNSFEYAVLNDFINDKGIINKAVIKNNCLTVKSKVDNFKICKDDKKYVTSYYKTTNKDKYQKEYNNIKIYDLDNYNYFVWNYDSFLSINNDKIKKISLFKEDKYSLDLITKYDNYLVIPDYDSEYYFNKFYLINSSNNEIKEVDLNRKIYFDSYFLGDYKNRLYLYDLDREKEYSINLKNGDVTKTSYQILINNKWENTSKIKLNKKNLVFKNDNLFEYIINDNKLYYKTPVGNILITNQEVDKIIEVIDDNVFYLSNNSIYRANLKTGISKVMTYSEWEFNNKNIYIFSK